MPTDGVLDHNFILQHYLDEARERNSDICIASLNLTNTFGSVPIELIDASLCRTGARDTFIDVIRSITRENSRFMTTSGETNEISGNCGVRQGCPISELLFNIVIEPILWTAIATGLDTDPDFKYPCPA